VVGVPLALPGCVWRPPQEQGVRLGVQRRPLDAIEDEAAAILGMRGKSSGHGGQAGNRAGNRGRAGIGHDIERQKSSERQTKKRGKQRSGRSHLAGRISARRRRRPRSLAHLPVREEPRGPAHLCRSARTRAALGISAARAAPPPLRLRAAPPLLVHSPVRPRLRAPPLLVLRGLVRPLQDRNGQVIPSLSLCWSAALRSSFPLLCFSAPLRSS